MNSLTRFLDWLDEAAGISRASAQKYHAMLTAEKAVQ